MARILGIGIVTLDIINTVRRYPLEDGEIRASAQRRSRGGNATNTLVVLSQLGHRCAWAGVVADGADGQHVLADLGGHGIDTRLCRTVAGSTIPTSYITLSAETGTRTIVHYRELPEYDFASFAVIDPVEFDWLHFEGRQVAETKRMLERAHELAPAVPRSVEIEKPRADIESLFEAAEVLMFSRHYALAAGYQDGTDFLRAMRSLAPEPILVCAWGEQGACALSEDDQLCVSPAFPPSRLVDTIGAGDVFNAAMIHGLVTGLTLEATLEDACRLAGRKCGQEGLDGLVG